MGRKRVIPVISGLDFDDVEEFSSLLGDRNGLGTDTHGLDEIADLFADRRRRTYGADSVGIGMCESPPDKVASPSLSAERIDD